jgi:hypothetical protein
MSFNVKIYAVGGFGINIGTAFIKAHLADKNLSHVDVVFVDTSDANMRDERLRTVDESKIYRFPKLKGGGKNRKELHPKIVPHVPELLSKLQPTDFNIVVHSASGASGSTVGPEIVREILQRNGNVLVLQAGSTSDRMVLTNTVGTMKSYAAISRRLNKPIVSYMNTATKTLSPSEVDQRAIAALYLMSIVFSDKNDRVDTTDLTNLLNYHKVTNFEPEFSGIEFFHESVNLPGHIVPQAAVMLVPQANTDHLGVPVDGLRVDYICDGVICKEFEPELEGRDLFAVVYTGDSRRTVELLQEELDKYEAEAQQRSRVHSRLDDVSESEDGMVF